MTGENEKNSMCQEMWRIAQDLSRIANGIENNMQGIDKGKCAAELRTISNYGKTKKIKKCKNKKGYICIWWWRRWIQIEQKGNKYGIYKS